MGNLISKLTNQGMQLESLNRAIAEKGLKGLTPEETQLFQQFYFMPITGMSMPSSKQIAKKLSKLPLSLEDRNIAGRFVEFVEKGGRKSMGQVGQGAQAIAEGLGAEGTIGNKALAGLLNRAVKIADLMRGVK